MPTLDALNAASAEDFAAALDGIFEHAPWVPAAAAASRPFASVEALHNALMQHVRQADAATRLRFLRGHPPLSAAAIQPGLTASSTAEQAALGLASLGDDATRFAELSAAYEARCGIPFIICARRHTPSSVLANLERRLAAPPEAEPAAALAEIFFISRLRLVARVSGPGMPRTTGQLSTQLLTAGDQPPPEIRLELRRDGATLLDRIINDRAEHRLIADEPLRIGPHELRIHLAGMPATAPIRLAISEPEGHYHMPVLIAG